MFLMFTLPLIYADRFYPHIPVKNQKMENVLTFEKNASPL